MTKRSTALRFALALLLVIPAGCSFDRASLSRFDDPDATPLDLGNDDTPLDGPSDPVVPDIRLDAPFELTDEPDVELDQPLDRGDDGVADLDAGRDAPDADVPDVPPDADAGDVPPDVADVADVPVGECSSSTDCADAFGPAPCGAWECLDGVCNVICADCTDGDLDGFGVGAGCAGADCDDGDDQVFDESERGCYDGPNDTNGVGACRPGQELCRDGVWGACFGQRLPQGEACNGLDDACDTTGDGALSSFDCGLGACAETIPGCAGGEAGACAVDPGAESDVDCDGADDDCDGAIDEACPVCVTVSPTGNDEVATADDNATPFATIQAAIDWAAADASRPQRLCVAGGATCSNTHIYEESVDMVDGIGLYGSFEATTWTRCMEGRTTSISSQRAEGLVFGSAISQRTELNRFRLLRLRVSATAGATIDGATNVVISDVLLNDIPLVDVSYGIDVINGGAVSIVRSSIHGGRGRDLSIGVRAVDSTVTLIENCGTFDDQDRCVATCGSSTQPGIRGRSVDTNQGESYAVYLDGASGSRLRGNALCSVPADTGAALVIVDDASDVVVRGNTIDGAGAAGEVSGIWLADCGGASPWIVDNPSITATGPTTGGGATSAVGVRSQGDCHPVIDGNGSIGADDGDVSAGVRCEPNDAGTPSRCVIEGNAAISGSTSGATQSYGVDCLEGSCERVAHNGIHGGTATDIVVGLGFADGDVFVEANRVTGGCASFMAGISSVGASGRIENNVIVGGNCTDEVDSNTFVTGLIVALEDIGDQLDVHSNSIAAGGVAGDCQASGVRLEAVGAPTLSLGIFRNNTIRATGCAQQRVFEEVLDTVDPAVFENNNLDPTGVPTALYFDEGTTALVVGAVNDLTDMRSSGNLAVDSQFVDFPDDPRLQAGSELIDAGTDTGAPPSDFEGDARGAAPDIGADEAP